MQSCGSGGDNSRGIVVSMINGTAAFGMGVTFDLGIVIDSQNKSQMYLSIGHAYGMGASIGAGVKATNKGFKTSDIKGEAVGGSVPAYGPLSLEGSFSSKKTQAVGFNLAAGTGYFVTHTNTITAPVQNTDPISAVIFGF